MSNPSNQPNQSNQPIQKNHEDLEKHLVTAYNFLEGKAENNFQNRLKLIEDRFMELSKKIISPESKGKIYSIIPKIMEEIGTVGKDRKAPDKVGGYAFRGIDDMYNAIQPALIKHGVFYTPKILKTDRRDRSFSGGASGVETFVEVEYTFYADDGSKFVATSNGEAMDTGDKSSSKAMSNALKYCLMQVFCIPTEEPKDIETEHNQIAKPNEAKVEPVAAKEEVKPQQQYPTRPQAPEAPRQYLKFEGEPGDYVINFIKSYKGKKIKELTRAEVENVKAWAQRINKFEDFVTQATLYAQDQAWF